MNTTQTPRAPSQSGFTLVEIMVGLAIGMLATIVIIQVISVFEAQKRVTTGTADAQINGSIALFNLTRELNLAGYPLMPVTNSPLECTTVNVGATGVTSITPVTITDGVNDTITVRYGTSNMGGIPNEITGNGATANERTMNNNLGCSNGDIAVIISGSTCTLARVTNLSAASATPATIELDDATSATAGSNLACLGAWNEITYRVNNGILERQGTPSVAGIVNMQAQYGISAAANDNQITQWVDASGGWAAPSVADRNRIKAVRVAVVARDDKLEAGNVTAACSSTSASAVSGLCAWVGTVSSPAPTIDLSADADWQRHRYRVFETIVPLRNVIWAKDTL